MAVFDYNLSASDVKEKLPVDPRAIPATATSGRLDDTDIEGYIEEGAAELSGVLQQAGLDGSDLADEALQQIQSGVLQYAVAETLQSIGHTGSAYTSARSRYEEIRDRYDEDMSTLDRDQSRVRSNVDTTSDKAPSKFGGVSYEL